jgi:SNF2 family DNA or RNA helicase
MASYGTIKLVRKTWVINCEPHVRIRLKSLFPKVDKKQYDHIALTDTPEICRELLWFCQRYPMEVENLHYMEEQASQHEKNEKLVYDITHGYIPPAEFDLQIPLRKYQRIAADIALKTGGLLIADDVGLGKTAASIGVMSKGETLPALVVTLTHLPFQWEREIKRFAPQLSTHIVKQGTPYPIGFSPDVLLMGYHKLHGWADILAGDIRCVVFDEIQELRRGSISMKGSAAYHIAGKAAYRIGLSATPFYNYGGEMYNIMQAIKPGVLGEFREFANDWATYDGKRIRDPKAFGTYLRDSGLMIRRTREDVDRGLPTLTKVPYWFDADFDALDSMVSSADELAFAILGNKKLTKQTEQFAAEQEFNNLLRQATGIAKAAYVAEFVRMLVSKGEQVVLYAWHREVYSILMDRLSESNPVMYTGSESAKQKEKAFKKFVNKESSVLLISLRAGAGLDGLQHHCKTVVFGELDWSPGVHEQNIGRVHRDGQLDEVKAYFLLAKQGSDPFIARVLGIKKSQVEGVKDPKGAVIPNYDTKGLNIRELALDYMNRRRGKVKKKKVKIIGIKRRGR